jgi:hypothetical protein
MLRIYAHKYIQLGQDIQNLKMTFYMMESTKGDKDHKPLTPEETNDLKKNLESIKSLCQDLELTTSL